MLNQYVKLLEEKHFYTCEKAKRTDTKIQIAWYFFKLSFELNYKMSTKTEWRGIHVQLSLESRLILQFSNLGREIHVKNALRGDLEARRSIFTVDGSVLSGNGIWEGSQTE